MEQTLEEKLFEATVSQNLSAVTSLLAKGANPYKSLSHNKTILGEAAKTGNVEILKNLLGYLTDTHSPPPSPTYDDRPRPKSFTKRKQAERAELFSKYGEKKAKRSTKQYDNIEIVEQENSNQGYFILIHDNDDSSSDESVYTSVPTTLTPVITPSPQDDLEWDEDIGNVASPTTEDKAWSSTYQWYAHILECTGPALESASTFTYDIDQQDNCMRTALHYAAERGHLEALKLLLEAGCKIDVLDESGFTALHIAVLCGRFEVATYLIEAGSNVNIRSNDKETPLHFASKYGHIDLVKSLLSYGANTETRDKLDQTALFLAIAYGQIEVVEYLILVGAHVNCEDGAGFTPLCKAVWQGRADIVRVLLEAGARITPSHKLLHYSIFSRKYQLISLLIEFGASPNLHGEDGDTPLLLAIRMSEPVIVRTLLQNGANVNSINDVTRSNALHIAVEDVRTLDVLEKILTCLFEYKININACALAGDTALNRAITLGRDQAAILLIRHGADVNICDMRIWGLNNLMRSSMKKTNQITCLLLKAGHSRQNICPFYLRSSEIRPPVWSYDSWKFPLRLANQCRIKIRQLCRNRVMFKYISELPLPPYLKSFLRMDEYILPLPERADDSGQL